MLMWSQRRWVMPTLVACIAIVLGTLAVMQYRWISEANELEQQRMTVTLDAAARHLADDLDGELMQMARVFERSFAGRPNDLYREPPGSRGSANNRHTDSRESEMAKRLEEAWLAWQQSSSHPELLRGIYVAGIDGETLADDTLRPRLARFDPDESTPHLEEVSWPVDLEAVAQLVVAAEHEPWPRNPREGRGPFPQGPPVTLEPQTPALVLWPSRGTPTRLGAMSRRPQNGRPSLVLELDRRRLRDEILPALVQRYFGALELPLDLEVSDGRNILFRSGEPAEDSAADFDLVIGLLRLPSPRNSGLGRPPRRAFGRPQPRTFGFVDPSAGSAHSLAEVSEWSLRVRHRAGSLEAAAHAAKLRNLTLSLGALGLLAIASGLALAAAHRERTAARRQLDLVASLTHELNTPVAALRSAAQNLADGIISDHEKIAQYGKLIQRESDRLSHLVTQALTFSGLAGSGRPVLASQNPRDLFNRARASCAGLESESGAEVRLELEPQTTDGEVRVEGDAAQLERLLANLLSNALKYGQGEVVLRTRVAKGSRAKVFFEVEDNGPGIDPRERDEVLAPFVRGRAARQRTVPGSGLGLTLAARIARSHGGRLTIDSGRLGGTLARLELPAVIERPAGR